MVNLVAVELHSRRNVGNLAIDSSIQITLLLELFEQLAVVSLTSADNGSQQRNFATRKAILDQFDNAFVGVMHHLLARYGRICARGTSIQQTQEIVDLGNRTHRRTRVLVGGLLLDRHNGAQTRNLIDIRTFHIADELAGIGRKGLHIATLPLGIDRIEGQR